MKGLRSIRALAKESLRGVEPAKIVGKPPKCELVDPRHLFVEDDYQRTILNSGTNLIRKIYSGFSWARYKPPICVRVGSSGGALVCIDGQHTATAAATLGIWKIPVMVVSAESVKDRAQAFVGHNRDRVALTPMAIFKAELASGDELAQAVDRACKQSGAEIITKSISLSDPTAVGKTIAVGVIKSVTKNKGEETLARVLKILVKAGRGPIRAEEIAAAALAIDGADHSIDMRLVDVVKRQSAERWRASAASMAADTQMATPIAMAALWRDALGLARPVRTLKHTSSQRHGDVFKPQKSRLSAKQEPLPKPAIERAPVIEAAPTSAAAAAMIERDGVRIDLQHRRLIRKGERIELSEQETGALAALVKVMPAILPNDRIAMKAFGDTSDAAYRVKALAQKLSPRLAAIGLKLREVPKMGFALGDAA